MKAARLFFKRPWIIIAICVILTGVFGFFITGLGIDNSIRQFLPQKDASYTRLTQTEDEFGSMIVIGVSLESKKGTILTPENIEVVKIRPLTKLSNSSIGVLVIKIVPAKDAKSQAELYKYF